MNPPRYLDKDAREHWKRHCQACIANGSLTESTSDSFSLLCRLWSILQNTDPLADSKEAIRFVGMLKQYLVMAGKYGLINNKAPATRPTQSIGDIIKNALQSKTPQEEEQEPIEVSDR
jgi:phage terminase small subunit